MPKSYPKVYLRNKHTVLTLKNDKHFCDNQVNEIKNCSLRIGERFYRRFIDHIQLLKRLNIIKNQQDWVEDAVLSKLEKEEEQNATECLHREKHLNFKINSQIDSQVERRVQVIKKIRSSFSKKKWFLEAIHEKLETEEMETKIKTTKELLKSMLNEALEISNVSSKLDK